MRHDGEVAISALHGAAGAGLRGSRARAIYGALLEAILANRLSPLTRLPEDDLGGIYGASRTIVRSALEALARDGVLVIEPNRGAFVASPGVAEAREVFDARLLIEPRLPPPPPPPAGEAEAGRLAAHLDEERSAVADQRQQHAILLSGRFHVLVAEIAGQGTLARFVRELVSRSSLIVALYWRQKEATCSCHAHEDIARALGAGDGERAAALMAEHLAETLAGLDLTETRKNSFDLAAALGGKAG